MSADELPRIEAELRAWGLLEAEGEPRLSRRFRGALARAAALLQEEEATGRRPEGHPVARAVDAALASFTLPPGAAPGPRHRAFLVAVEVASLPENVRAMLGV